MKFNTQHYYDKNKHTYCCLIDDNHGHTFVGKAICAEEDREFESEKIGFNIATARAQIKAIKYVIELEEQELKGLKHYLSVVSRSKFFSIEKYMKKMLFRQINHREIYINELKEEVKHMQTEIQMYIIQKDDYHAKIRSMRKKGENK